MIRLLGFLDVTKVAGAFAVKFHDRLTDVLPGVREIALRVSTEDGFEDTDTLKEWNTATAFLKRLKNDCASFLQKPVEIEEARVIALDPESHVPWGQSDRTRDPNVGRLLINLKPSPAAMVFSGPQQLVLWPGQVALVEHRVLNSMVNFGRDMVAYLQVDVRVLPNPMLEARDYDEQE